MNQKISSSYRQASGGNSLARWLFLIALGPLLMPSAQALSPRVVITNAPGFTITWDGNDGGFSSPLSGAGPSNNIALASNGTVPFTSSDLGPVLGIPFHRAVNLNDGLYGNSKSWISANGVGGTSDPDPFCGLAFDPFANVQLKSIAWSRDNGNIPDDCCGGTLTDRASGAYTLQYTTVSSPDATTADTGDPATGWNTIGSVTYLAGANDASFSSYLRHRFDVAQGGAAIAATGIRIKVSDGSIDIDEIEVNPIPDALPPISNFVEIQSAAGFSIVWDRNQSNFSASASVPENDASLNRGAVAFGSSQLGPVIGVPFHRFTNVNDGLYGNSHSWIPDFASAHPDPAPFIGINFGKPIHIENIAWSRDNTSGFTDRSLGLYTLQITTMPNPASSVVEVCGPGAAHGWVTVGTVNYKLNDPKYFESYLRHRFDLTQNGGPIVATGLRILVPNNNIDIDEIEVNANQGIEQNTVLITNAPSFAITWDGNDGQFNNPNPGAGPPSNIALATQGTTAFASSELGPQLNLPYHRATNLNDGLYGNSHSWISANGIGGTSDPEPFAGLSFSSAVTVTNIAWSRDNGDATPGDLGCGGTCADRALDTYSLQFTSVSAPDANTPETGDATTGWADIGSVTLSKAAPPFFTPYLRHRFDIVSSNAPLSATGIRIKVANGTTDLDEIEVNTAVTAPPNPGPVTITPVGTYTITWDGNEGQFFTPAPGAAVPLNQALASQGATAFASSELGPILAPDFPFHRATNINDGFYGNSHSWISANGIGGTSDPEPFVGVSFIDSISVTNIAWSRNNGDTLATPYFDRDIGTYTLQFTTVFTPDANTPETEDKGTGWETIGTVQYIYSNPPDFHPWLRHRFAVSAAGSPIDATGLRLKVSDGTMDLDEMEVNTAVTTPLPRLTIDKTSGNPVLFWNGGGALQSAPSLTGPWTCVPGTTFTYPLPHPPGGLMKFYRIQQ